MIILVEPHRLQLIKDRDVKLGVTLLQERNLFDEVLVQKVLQLKAQTFRQYLHNFLDFFLGCVIHDAFVLLEVELKLLGEFDSEVELRIKVTDLTVELLGGFVAPRDLAELAGHVSQHI